MSELAVVDEVLGRAARDGRAARGRRLRHRLLVADVPHPDRGGRAEGRPLLRRSGWPTRRRPRRSSGPPSTWAASWACGWSPRAWRPPTSGRAGRAGLHRGAGLPLLQADAGGQDRRGAAGRCATRPGVERLPAARRRRVLTVRRSAARARVPAREGWLWSSGEPARRRHLARTCCSTPTTRSTGGRGATEAFAEARRRDVPVLISVGYAACHWCHVMAHESFEDEAVGAADQRRLRRDQGGPGGAARRRRGLHDRHPGDDRPGRLADDRLRHPGRRAVLLRHLLPAAQLRPAARVGRRRPGGTSARRCCAQGAAVVEAIGGAQAVGRPDRAARPPSCSTPRSPSWPASTTDATAASAARRSSRRTWRCCSCCATTSAPATRASLEMVRHTAEAMARGGIYDQLAGGFARYSVDAHWTVPHFEKMLYDNALLLRVYTQLWRLTGDPLAAPGRRARPPRSCSTTWHRPAAGSPPRWTRTPTGVEGATYAWTPGAARRGARRRRTAPGPPTCSASPTAGTFEHGTSVLRLARDVDDADAGGARSAGSGVRGRLLAARAPAPAAGPGRQGGRRLERAGGHRAGRVRRRACAGDDAGRWRRHAAAIAAMRRGRWRWHRAPGRRAAAAGLPGRRGRRAGRRAGGLRLRGRGVLRVHQLTGDGRWLDAGRRAARHRAGPLRATGDGGFYDTADDAERLVTRPADPTDNATPSGLSAIAAALVGVRGADRGDRATGRRPSAALATVAPIVGRHPRFAGYAGRGRRGAAVRAVRDRDRHRRPGRRPAGRGRAPARPARARWSWPARRTSRACRCSPTGRCVDGRSDRVRLPGLRLRPSGDHGRGAGRAARLTR